MKKRASFFVTILAIAVSASLWLGARQRERATTLEQELRAQSSKIEMLNRLRKEMINQPIPPPPDKSKWGELKAAQRELYKLRGEARRIKEAARWDTSALRNLESQTRSELAAVELRKQQTQALGQLATKGKKLDKIGDGIANAFATALRKHPEMPFPKSLEQLGALATENVTDERFLGYIEANLKKVTQALENTGTAYDAFEAVRENRFFTDGRPRWFIRTKTATQMPDGRYARSYWPVWTKDFDSKIHLEFRVHSDVYEDTSKHIQLVYEQND